MGKNIEVGLTKENSDWIISRILEDKDMEICHLNFRIFEYAKGCPMVGEKEFVDGLGNFYDLLKEKVLDFIPSKPDLFSLVTTTKSPEIKERADKIIGLIPIKEIKRVNSDAKLFSSCYEIALLQLVAERIYENCQVGETKSLFFLERAFEIRDALDN